MPRNKGMTLLEVLVALAIFATAALAVMRTVTQHINTLGVLEEKAFAAMVADNQLAMIMLAPSSLQATQGETDLAGRHWFYRITPQATDATLLHAVDVSVATSKEGVPTVTVRSYIDRSSL